VDSQTVKGKGNQLFSKRSFHALRHSFTSALANENVSSELRMKLTGHSSEGEQKNTRITKWTISPPPSKKSRPSAQFDVCPPDIIKHS
jgi:integrase